MDESGYRGPGGPGSLVPTSPKPSTPTSPSDRRAPFPSGGSGRYLDPKILINTPADELPEGVNPTQREVGAENYKTYRYNKEAQDFN